MTGFKFIYILIFARVWEIVTRGHDFHVFPQVTNPTSFFATLGWISGMRWKEKLQSYRGKLCLLMMFSFCNLLFLLTLGNVLQLNKDFILHVPDKSLARFHRHVVLRATNAHNAIAVNMKPWRICRLHVQFIFPVWGHHKLCQVGMIDFVRLILQLSQSIKLIFRSFIDIRYWSSKIFWTWLEAKLWSIIPDILE